MADQRRRPMTKQEYRQMKKAKEKLRRQMEREAQLGRKYLKSLRSEMVRLAGLAEPEAEHALLKKVADRLDEEELLGLIQLYRGRVDRLLSAGPQLCYGEDEPTQKTADMAFLI